MKSSLLWPLNSWICTWGALLSLTAVLYWRLISQVLLGLQIMCCMIHSSCPVIANTRFKNDKLVIGNGYKHLQNDFVIICMSVGYTNMPNASCHESLRTTWLVACSCHSPFNSDSNLVLHAGHAGTRATENYAYPACIVQVSGSDDTCASGRMMEHSVTESKRLPVKICKYIYRLSSDFFFRWKLRKAFLAAEKSLSVDA